MDPNLKAQVPRPLSANIPPQGPWPNLVFPPLQHPQSHSPVPHTYLEQLYIDDMPNPSTSANVDSQQQYQSHGLLPPSSSRSQVYQPIVLAPPWDRRPEYNALPSGALSQAENRRSTLGNADGILPNLSGRPAAIIGMAIPAIPAIPMKDADGKFPCPLCDKTYLHAKHLKRHLLRHTGDRSYMCVLCNDAFFRSDILKRHFQKCSLRRGNPTGVGHLAHRRAHLEKAQTASAVSKSVPGDISSSVPASNGTVRTTFGEEAVNGVAVVPGQYPRYVEEQPLGYPMQPVGVLSRGEVYHDYPREVPRLPLMAISRQW
ncbi:hypothetical protein EMCG_08222 [[Emmonsia] crescens]|uniref:C2H2-type domain-containing protein n=1 Tax=[Emmonsia] crescens TaxID=73230 RepID=A0A0G2I6D0_9EURO|nr:hypothetical protein EMCG_08222 [Emmonsia crescens UAMH 3008]